MVTTIVHPSVEERKAQGKAARQQAAPADHAGWTPVPNRPDPVALLEAQNTTREPDLVPVRHGRMMVSPFTFYRGAAKIMAADLKDTPTAGLNVQLCGDAHLSNFGVFASPERTLLFDVNDFDETLPGPFEYDVKRMAASFAIAARNNAFAKSDVRVATTASVRAYREAMTAFADADTMDIWYAHISADDVLQAMRQAAPELKGSERKRVEKNAQKTVAKAHTRDSLQALSKLAEYVDGQYRIVSQPPVVVPIRELPRTAGMSSDEIEHMIHEQFRAYRATLQDDRRHLLERFEVIDIARKVVGCRQCRYASVHRAAPRPRPTRPAVPASQGSHPIRLGGPPPEEPLPPARRTRRARPTDDASRQRHLLGLDQRRRRGPLPVLAPTPRHERLRGHRDHGPGHPRVLRPRLRPNPRPRARPIRRPHRDRRLPRQEGQVRPRNHRLLRTLRRPKRTRLRRPSPKQSAPADSKHSKACNGYARPGDRPLSTSLRHPRRGISNRRSGFASTVTACYPRDGSARYDLKYSACLRTRRMLMRRPTFHMASDMAKVRRPPTASRRSSSCAY